jgi:SAM-dependent methyltransferase
VSQQDVPDTEVWRLYEDAAADFARDRQRLIGEERYLNELIAGNGTRPSVLDLGCGSGVPIARFLIERGCAVTGVDAATAMIAIARANFPAMRWIVGDMRRLALGERFDAVLAWNSFFHLTADDQRGMFAVFRDHVAPGGRLLFTAGPEAGEAIGELYGRRLYHASLASAEYRELLDRHGFEVLTHVVEDPDCGGHTVWLARSR